MAQDTTPKAWPAESRGLLDDLVGYVRAAIRGCFAASGRRPGRPGRLGIPAESSAPEADIPSGAGSAIRRGERPAVHGLGLRTDLEDIKDNLDERLLRDIGLGPGELELAGRHEADATQRSQREDIMARESTPSAWPSDTRGLLDDAGDAAKAAGWFKPFKELVRFLGADDARAGSRGRVSATLEKGQCLALEGSRPAMVECLDGAAWITCPSDGRDVQLRAGETARIEEPGGLVVAALGGPARIRMAWR